MASNQRLEDLSFCCGLLKKSLEEAEASRDQLIEWSKEGTYVFENDKNEDLFPTLIKEADSAVEVHRRILLKMESLRDRALNGEGS